MPATGRARRLTARIQAPHLRGKPLVQSGVVLLYGGERGALLPHPGSAGPRRRADQPQQERSEDPERALACQDPPFVPQQRSEHRSLGQPHSGHGDAQREGTGEQPAGQRRRAAPLGGQRGSDRRHLKLERRQAGPHVGAGLVADAGERST